MRAAEKWMGSHPKSQDRGSPLPPAPSVRRGFTAADAWDTPPGPGGGKGSWTHLRGECCYLEASPGYAQTKASPARLQPGIPGLPSPVPGFSEHLRKMRAGADSASKQGHPGQRGLRRGALLSRGGSGLQLAVGSPSPGGSCVPCHSRSLCL